MENTDDKKISEELFGSVKRATKVGGLQPDFEQIRRDLATQPNYLCALFCTGCGFEQGLTPKGVESLASYHEIEITPTAETLIVVDGCQCCDTAFRNLHTMQI